MWNISVQIVPSNGLVGVMETVFTKGKYRQMPTHHRGHFFDAYFITNYDF